MNFRNSGVDMRRVVANVGSGYLKFGLEAESWRRSYRSDRTHVKDMKDAFKAQPPGSDHLFIACAEKSSGYIPFTPLDNFPPDPDHSPVIGSMVSKSSGVCIACSAHVVNCSIASRTGWLS